MKHVASTLLLLLLLGGREAQAQKPVEALDSKHPEVRLEAFLPTRLDNSHVEAAQAYRRLLRNAGTTPAKVEMLKKRIARLVPLLPEVVLRQVIEGDWRAPPEEWKVKEEAGKHLLAWWRSQDPLPATPENERLAEHLRRVAHAKEHYAHEESLVGFDDRGVTYVRYGPPARRGAVEYNSSRFFREVFRFGVPVSRGDFPGNELWLYSNIDRAGYYLFVEADSGYRLAETTNELLPSGLRRGFGRTDRGLNIAYSATAALRFIYEQLALYHSDFALPYSQVENYAAFQEQQQSFEEKGVETPSNRVTVGFGVGHERVVAESPRSGAPLPHNFVQATLSDSRTRDRRAVQRREEAMPRQHSGVMEGKAKLPVTLRAARFLEKEGTTRVEVYWSIPPEGLSRSDTGAVSGDLLFLLTAVPQSKDFRRQTTDHKRYLLERTMGKRERVFPPQTYTFESASDTFHLALQWNRHPARFRNGVVLPGSDWRVYTHCLDSLTALSDDGSRLEMSDLKPMVLPQEEGLGEAKLTEAATLYPFPAVASETPLLLYFETYHLAFGINEKTRYTVEYEIYRRTERGGLRGVLGGDEQQRTATKATYTGESRTAKEFILLDLEKWSAEEGSKLRITVRVTDEVTEQEKERSIDFEVYPEQ